MQAKEVAKRLKLLAPDRKDLVDKGYSEDDILETLAKFAVGYETQNMKKPQTHLLTW